MADINSSGKNLSIAEPLQVVCPRCNRVVTPELLHISGKEYYICPFCNNKFKPKKSNYWPLLIFAVMFVVIYTIMRSMFEH